MFPQSSFVSSLNTAPKLIKNRYKSDHCIPWVTSICFWCSWVLCWGSHKAGLWEHAMPAINGWYLPQFWTVLHENCKQRGKIGGFHSQRLHTPQHACCVMHPHTTSMINVIPAWHQWPWLSRNLCVDVFQCISHHFIKFLSNFIGIWPRYHLFSIYWLIDG